MRNTKSTVAMVLLIGLLFGCATGGFPSDPKDQAIWYVEKAAGQAERGDFERVAFMLTEAVSRPTGVDAAKELLLRSPSIRTGLVHYFEETQENSKDKEALNNLAGYIPALGKSGVIQNAEELSKSLDENIARKNSHGEIGWLLSDNISNLKVLQSEEAQEVIFKRSLDAIADKQRPTDLAKALAGYLSRPERKAVDLTRARNSLSDVTLKRSELQEFRTAFPDLVHDKLAELSAYVQINVTPSDRLLEEDLKAEIGRLSENYIVLRNGERGTSGTINVTIEKLRLEDRQLPDQSQTITYAFHNVDPVQAALFMPRHASYMYDIKSGGVELEYGYVVHLEQNGITLLDELVRGTIKENFVRCENPRVVNVFGGITRANFVANGDMSSRCSGATTSSPSVQTLKGQVLALLVDKIVSVGALASRRE